MAFSAGLASSSRLASEVPPHSAVPTASVSQGWLMGRGSSSARPLPAHSNVIGSAWRGRSFRALRESELGRSTAPAISRRKLAGSTAGMS